MNPEEKALLERTLELSEENNRLLEKIEKRARWAVIWGFIKVIIIIVPLIAGYIYLQPFIEQSANNFQDIREFLNF
ncbi:MAG: hypothetical protein CO183_02785 [Candidatus Zambryskibacteria bacterium CG_4_9_14_3_um_filter_42_9]|uniref:Uncharacterized protein n=1 Tax=Candidatus Zambryskibacteria bacterium CG22_combo_CG10-13_8_21_14_all_42_17 TaxID=1975118 RepID=A0A2H0BDB9_9BACT|nr:MAG: hypothetical protein COX06_02470 [Candidatus Zambryskibacteria bacterium CG22_combo_CG10-13_8_21_14_all_42_17]PJA36590.1 MAG: hypothetical protein CO183_02785 [Candidatus Zambryskibacteria bacterium CG_4_9_14_3_um_filter_42_9]